MKLKKTYDWDLTKEESDKVFGAGCLAFIIFGFLGFIGGLGIGFLFLSFLQGLGLALLSSVIFGTVFMVHVMKSSMKRLGRVKEENGQE